MHWKFHAPDKPRLVLDVETYSASELKFAGPHAYAEHPSTGVHCLAWELKGGHHPGKGLWLPGQPIPRTVWDHIMNKTGPVVAHNWLFEHAIFVHILGPLYQWPQPLRSLWSCTMARALYHGLPGGLDLLSEALELDNPKDKSARRNMLYLAKPRTRAPDGTPTSWWHHDPKRGPEMLRKLYDYCIRDVAAESEADDKLPELPERERRVFLLDAKVNLTGVRVDLPLVSALQDITTDELGRIDQVVQLATGGAVKGINQTGALRAWVQAKTGVVLPSLAKAVLPDALEATKGTAAHIVVQARAEGAKSSTGKLQAMQASVSRDGRARLLFQYYGAGRTGRWAGRRVQPQNMPRPLLKDAELRDAIAWALKGRRAQEISTFFPGTVMGVVSSCLRGCLVAAPGHALVSVDLSQIEARVVAWLAGQRDILDVFRRGEDVYTHTARKIGSSSRQMGKVLVLACIAEGSLVQTVHGLVPIEKVTRDMRVWDGVEWVSHDGVIFRGEKEIIEYDGLRATPDHQVWTEGRSDSVPLGYAASTLSRLVRPGAGGAPIRVLESIGPDLQPREEGAAHPVPVHSLWARGACGLAQPDDRGQQGVFVPVTAEHGPLSRSVDAEGGPMPAGCAQPLHQPEQPELGGLRRPKDYLCLPECESRDGMGSCEPWPAECAEVGDRSAGQRQRVCAGQPAVGHAVHAEFQPAAKVRVYDILNAGPRHRFTVSGRLVSNCGFGMGGPKFAHTAGTYGIELDEETAQGLVWDWREANPAIVQLWRDLGDAFKRVVQGPPGAWERLGHLQLGKTGRAVRIRLPSGRDLVYQAADVGQDEKGRDELGYLGVHQLTNRWMRLRTYGGKLCLGADTQVLTRRGWVRIVDVLGQDEVWDGEEWVRHAGLIDQGMAETVQVDGVQMTPDHEVLTTQGWVHGAACEGLYRAPVALPDRGSAGGVEADQGGIEAGLGNPLRVRPDPEYGVLGLRQGDPEVMRLQAGRADRGQAQDPWYEPAPGVRDLAFDAGALWNAKPSSLEELRWPGPIGLSGMADLYGVLAGYGADLPAWLGAGSQGQRLRLFGGELPVGYAQGEPEQQTKLHCPGHAAGSDDGRGGIEADRDRRDDATLPTRPRLAPVFDLLDAGPRRRFVVRGETGPLIVHNCENVVQAVARDVLSDAILALDQDDYRVVGTVHDEALIEAPESQAAETLAAALEIFRRTPPWAPNLPVGADGWHGPRYRK